MSSYSLTKSRAFQYVGILLALATLATGYWYFSVRASTLNKSPTSSLTSGLVGYWTFDGADISGTTATDRSGNAYNGTLTNGPTKTEGKLGQALNFDGTDDYVEVGDLDVAGAITIAAWIYPMDRAVGWQDIVVKEQSGAINYYLETKDDDGLEFGFTGAVTAPHAVNDVLTLDTWNYVAVTFSESSNTVRMYVNGGDAYVNTAETGVMSTTTNYGTKIGAGFTGEEFKGKIDEVRVYNRALSATEVKSLYDLGASDKVNSSISQSQGTGRLDSGLALYWPLDAASGTSAVDSSTNGNNGTLTNMEDPGDWVTGQIANALDFDGSNEYVTVADPASGVLDAVGDQYYTLSGWFNRDTATTTDTILAKSNGPADTMGYLVYLDATTDKLVFATRSTLGDNIYETTSAYTAPGWHHFAIIFNIPRTGGNRGQIYIDGSIQNDNIGGGGYAGSIESTRAFVIGAESDGGNPFDGKLDEVRIYNRTLSADEVGQLYRLTSPTGTDTSLKGYWSFNGQDLSGTTAADRSGAGNNGTLTNGPTITEGKLGQALNFDGTDDYVDFGNITALNGASQLAVSAWVKHNGLLSAEEHIVDKANCAGAGVFMLYGGETPGKVEFDVFNGGESPVGGASSSRIDDGLWHLVTGTYDGSNVRIYVDGNQENAVSMTGPAYSRIYPVQVGGECDGNNLFWDGAVDEVRIYNRALSANEVKSLYDLGASDKVNTSVSQLQGTGRLDSGLAGYWKLDENTGTSAADTSTNASTGTLTNGPTWTTGRIGSAVTFDGTNDYIEMGNVATFNSLSRVTASAWVKTASLATEKHIVDKSHCDGGTNSAVFELYGGYAGVGRPSLTIYKNGGTPDYYIVDSTARVDDNAWHLVTGVYDGANLIIYVDGVNTGQTAAAGITMPSTTNTLQIGGNCTGNPHYWNGTIDDVRVYSRALSVDEISQLYRLTTPTGTDTSLKGYWSFNGQDLSGTTAADRSGAGNNGTLTNGPTITEGKLGQALNFDGTNDTVSISPTGLPTGSRTISVWAKATLLDGSYRGVIGYGNQNNGEAFAIQINSSNEWVITGWGAPNAVSGGAVVLNQWTHIVGTYSGGNASIYVNGVLVGGPAAITSAPNLNYSAIGSRLDGGGDYFPGQIDEVRIYNRVLSDTEVKALYNSGR